MSQLQHGGWERKFPPFSFFRDVRSRKGMKEKMKSPGPVAE